jgi:hypothetical protein
MDISDASFGDVPDLEVGWESGLVIYLGGMGKDDNEVERKKNEKERER